MSEFYSEKTLHIDAYWPGRPERAGEIAARLDRFLGDIAVVDPSLSRWSVGRAKPKIYPDAWYGSEFLVASDRTRDELGIVEDNGGYNISGLSLDKRQTFFFGGVAGAAYTWPMWNRLDFTTDPGREPNPSIATYPLFRRVMLSLIDCWTPAFCVARASKLKPDFAGEGWFAKAWMTYVPPSQAASIDLSGILLAETTPDGGLLLSATAELFDPDVFAHMHAAQDISRATQHLNKALPKL